MKLKLTPLVLVVLGLLTMFLVNEFDFLRQASHQVTAWEGFSSASEPAEVVTAEAELEKVTDPEQEPQADQAQAVTSSTAADLAAIPQSPDAPAFCGMKPNSSPAIPELGPEIQSPAPLQRFRVPVYGAESLDAPQEYQAIADRTNYGQRYLYDIEGRPTQNQPIIVIHETAGSAWGTVELFRTYHASEDYQVSYHSFITLTCDIVYIVPPDLRAFGAGNSVFVGKAGPETVKTDPKLEPSVNNFAYHVSLESPPDGYKNGPTHSGYTTAQYQSLAWLIARTGVPEDRITTHAIVDRTGTRADPRSFNQQTFLRFLRSYPKVQEINIGCRSPQQS
ncbi:MAG: peptidoglycan recognition family protein [Microcoleaceae cyanobacterium]